MLVSNCKAAFNWFSFSILCGNLKAPTFGNYHLLSIPISPRGCADGLPGPRRLQVGASVWDRTQDCSASFDCPRDQSQCKRQNQTLVTFVTRSLYTTGSL